MTTRETIAWALAAGLAVVLACAFIQIKDMGDDIAVQKFQTGLCEEGQAQCLETLDLCGRVVTELAAKCGECP